MLTCGVKAGSRRLGRLNGDVELMPPWDDKFDDIVLQNVIGSVHIVLACFLVSPISSLIREPGFLDPPGVFACPVSG